MKCPIYGAVANGFVVGAARGALIGSGAGISLAFATDFTAGSIGDALEQKITTGRVNLGKSLLGGAENALSQMLYDTGELKGVGDAFWRGAKTGALSSGFRNIEEALWPERSRDPKGMCGSPDPFDLADGLGNGRGYHSGRGHGGAGHSRTGEGSRFSLGGLVKDMVVGGIVGGLGSAGFYGAGKALDALKESFVGWRNDRTLIVKTQKNVELPVLPEGSQWERDVWNSFAGGKFKPVTYKGGTILYRVGGKNGGFWSLNAPPATEYQWRVDYAIKQEFCNDASTLYKMIIPKGSSLSGIEGIVGTQGMGLYGGAHQVYIDYRAVPSDWIEISSTNWK